MYYGLGGGLGQGAAFLLMPMLSVYVLHGSSFPITGWRGAFVLIAFFLGIIGILCLALLRSYPSHQHDSDSLDGSHQVSSYARQTNEIQPASYHVFKDPVGWLLGAYFSSSLIALRLVPAWISLYSSDIFRLRWSYEIDAAVVAGGGIGALYMVGHIVGSPLLGKLSDWLMKIGVQRLFLPTLSLGIGGLIVSLFLGAVPSPWLLGFVSLLLGIVLHAFPIINAAVSERWGVTMTGRSLGGINMVGQIVGALALSVSGYVGMAFSTDVGGPLSEYQGIWYSVMGCGVFGAICGWMAYRMMSSPSTRNIN